MTKRPAGAQYLTAHEAAARLGISRASLYAYVSRGRLRSQPDPANPRASRYLASDVERLLGLKRVRGRPELAALEALDWGDPVLESSLTLIEGGRLYYRGRDAVRLAREATFEDAVHLLWGWDAERPPAWTGVPSPCAEALRDALAALPMVERMQAVLPLAAADDASAFDLRPDAVIAKGWRILELLAAAATLQLEGPQQGMADRLATGWGAAASGARRLLDTALVLCADHELNVSAFAVRVVASTRSSPFDAVQAGLAALRGPRHGGHTARVEALLDEARSPEALVRTVAERIRRGEAVPGFGHPLYPAGDPRAAVLFQAVEALAPTSAEAAFARAGLEAGRDLLGEPPTLDFALVTLRRALGLPLGAALAIFALGRTAGWIAHAMEQYALDALIRPRAAYRGPPPERVPQY